MTLAVIILYGLVLLGIGIYSSMRVKTPSDYLIAGKRTGIAQVTGSLLATILGGSAVLGTIDLAHTQSWASAWYILSAAIGLLILVPLVKRVSKLGKFTLPELIGRFYGETARKTASIIIPLAWLGVIAAQIIASAQILSSFMDIDYPVGVLISGTIFMIYTYIGGQLSVLKTDFFQSFIILGGITVVFFILQQNPAVQVKPLQTAFPFNSNFRITDLLVLLLTFSSTFIVGPDIYSRVFCARDGRVAQTSVLLTALILIPFAFIEAYIGVFSVQATPELKGTSALVNLIIHYTPSWMIGLMVAALLSAVLSSASTTLLTASMIMSELFTKELEHPDAFRKTKMLVIVFGIASMLISLKITSIVSSLLLALTFYSGAFIVPVAAALLNLPVGRKYGITAMLAGGLTALAGKLSITLFHFEYGNLLIFAGFLINGTILFLTKEEH